MNTDRRSSNQKSHRRDAEAAEKEPQNRLLCELRAFQLGKDFGWICNTEAKILGNVPRIFGQITR